MPFASGHCKISAEAYLEKLRGREREEQALALASCLLTQGGYDFLQERLKTTEK